MKKLLVCFFCCICMSGCVKNTETIIDNGQTQKNDKVVTFLSDIEDNNIHPRLKWMLEKMAKYFPDSVDTEFISEEIEYVSENNAAFETKQGNSHIGRKFNVFTFEKQSISDEDFQKLYKELYRESNNAWLSKNENGNMTIWIWKLDIACKIQKSNKSIIISCGFNPENHDRYQYGQKISKGKILIQLQDLLSAGSTIPLESRMIQWRENGKKYDIWSYGLQIHQKELKVIPWKQKKWEPIIENFLKKDYYNVTAYKKGNIICLETLSENKNQPGQLESWTVYCGELLKKYLEKNECTSKLKDIILENIERTMGEYDNNDESSNYILHKDSEDTIFSYFSLMQNIEKNNPKSGKKEELNILVGQYKFDRVNMQLFLFDQSIQQYLQEEIKEEMFDKYRHFCVRG